MGAWTASVRLWARRHPYAVVVWPATTVAVAMYPAAIIVWTGVLLAVGAAFIPGASRKLHIDTSSATLPSPRRVVPDDLRASDLPGSCGSSSRSTTGTAAVGALSDAELCRAWQTSYVRLRRLAEHPHVSRMALAVLAHEREMYLDELQRRYPAGFAAWIAAGARAPSNPMPYLRRGLDSHKKTA